MRGKWTGDAREATGDAHEAAVMRRLERNAVGGAVPAAPAVRRASRRSSAGRGPPAAG